MKLTPAIKGQITKAIKRIVREPKERFIPLVVREIFEKHMPKEQAKHAARKYLATV